MILAQLHIRARVFAVPHTEPVCPTAERTIKIVYRCDLKSLILFSIGRSVARSQRDGEHSQQTHEPQQQQQIQFINYDSV